MIPFKDNIPSRTTPFITIFLIGANVAAFLYELSLGPRLLEKFIFAFGVIPARTFAWAELHQSLLGVTLPYLTSMFMHAGWMHLIGNMWYLWIFGDNIEDRLGHVRFFLFYLLCGFGAGIVHTIFNATSAVPSLGASGAIAGVLGAYLVTYPFAKVRTLIPIFIFFQVIEIPALIVLGFWFIMQLFSGTAALSGSTADTGGVAWWAHVGGFIIGIILMGLLARNPRYDYRTKY